MSDTIDWKIGDPCANCGGPMKLVPRPPEARVRIARDKVSGTPVPQTYDTAPPETIDELGDLYRCVPCWSQIRRKPEKAAAEPGTTAE